MIAPQIPKEKFKSLVNQILEGYPVGSLVSSREIWMKAKIKNTWASFQVSLARYYQLGMFPNLQSAARGYRIMSSDSNQISNKVMQFIDKLEDGEIFQSSQVFDSIPEIAQISNRKNFKKVFSGWMASGTFSEIQSVKGVGWQKKSRLQVRKAANMSAESFASIFREAILKLQNTQTFNGKSVVTYVNVTEIYAEFCKLMNCNPHTFKQKVNQMRKFDSLPGLTSRRGANGGYYYDVNYKPSNWKPSAIELTPKISTRVVESLSIPTVNVEAYRENPKSNPSQMTELLRLISENNALIGRVLNLITNNMNNIEVTQNG